MVQSDDIAQLIKVATSALKKLVYADATDWDVVCPSANTTTSTYMNHVPPHVKSLICISHLKTHKPRSTADGDEYPFVFGVFATNGLETACKLALSNAQSTLEFTDIVASTGSKAWCLATICEIGERHIVTPADEEYPMLVKTAALAKHSGISDVEILALKLARESCGETLAVRNVSPLFKESILEAVGTGKSSNRIGELFLKSLQAQIDSEVKTIELSQDEECWSRLAAALKLCKVPDDLQLET